VLNHACRAACGLDLVEVFSSKENFRKYTPLVGIYLAQTAHFGAKRPSFAYSVAEYFGLMPPMPTIRATVEHDATIVSGLYLMFFTIFQAWNRMTPEQQQRYLNEMGMGPSTTVLAIAPSTFALLSVVLPTKIACYAKIGMPIKNSHYLAMATLFTSFLQVCSQDEPQYKCVYAPTEEDFQYCLHTIMLSQQQQQ
jgi:hypothetical protein